MDIVDLLQRQETLVAEITKTLGAKAFDPSGLARPTEMQKAQANRIQERISALEAEAKDVAARIEGEIAALKAELQTLNQVMKADQKRSDPALSAAKVKVATRAVVSSKAKSARKKAP